MTTGAQSALRAAKAAFARGDLGEAERLGRLALAADPSLSGPWIVLADVALRRGRPETALESAYGAVRTNSSDPYAHFALGRCFVNESRLDDAVNAFEMALRLPNCSPALSNAVGARLAQLRRFDLAHRAYEQATKADPLHRAFAYDLAVSYRTFGAFEESERILDSVIASNSRFYDAYFMRSGVRRQTLARNHISEMEALLAAGVSEQRGEIAVRYAVGKELEDVGYFARAFQHFSAAATLQRSSSTYDVAGEISIHARIMTAQSSVRLKAMANGRARADSSRDDPIFIVGLPRSGTSLLERIIAGHSRVFAAGELGTLPSQLIRFARDAGITRAGDWVERLGDIDLTALGWAYADIARQTGVPAGSRFIDKYPPNLMLCGLIWLALPASKIIIVRRSPLDVCFGLYKTLFNTGVYPYSYDFEDLTRYHASTARLAEHWLGALSAERCIEVWYEDLVANTERETRRVLQFLNLPWESDVLRFHESSTPATTASAWQVRRPIYASSVGNWRNYADQLTKLTELLGLGDGSSAFG